jgi:hypothetical protein
MYVRTLHLVGEHPRAQALGRPSPAFFPGREVGLGQPLPLPRVVAFRFHNTGLVDADNCCAVCTTQTPATGGRLNLGVGLRGNGAVNRRAANGMELSFTISGHRAGLAYDIVRTRRNSFFERRGGVWTRLGAAPMGTADDRHDDEECLRPRTARIFAVDRPGWRTIALPAAPTTIFRSRLYGGLVTTHADATDVVSRFSFAEWVQARSQTEGVPWTRLELPPLRDGTPRRRIFWHSTIWLIRETPNDTTTRWILGPRSEIRLGALSGACVRAEPDDARRCR